MDMLSTVAEYLSSSIQVSAIESGSLHDMFLKDGFGE